MYLSGLLSVLTLVLVFSSTAQAQTVTDIDGHTYPVIMIGNQSWMAENLRTTRFANGDSIGTEIGATNNDTNAIYQWAYNDDTSLVVAYGRLYSWYAAVDHRNICPAGWHVPSLAEWDTLRVFLGGDSLAGNILKEIGTTHWIATDASVNNASGFTGRGSGFRGNQQGYSGLNERAFFWSTTQFGTGSFARGHALSLTAANGHFFTQVAVGNCGGCIRCIEDQKVRLHPAFPNDKLRIYPNPTEGLIFIDIPDHQEVTVSVVNTLGQRVYDKEFEENTPIRLDLHQAPGVYHLLIRSSTNVIQRSLIIR